jgi:hypothetical protein
MNLMELHECCVCVLTGSTQMDKYSCDTAAFVTRKGQEDESLGSKRLPQCDTR